MTIVITVKDAKPEDVQLIALTAQTLARTFQTSVYVVDSDRMRGSVEHIHEYKPDHQT